MSLLKIDNISYVIDGTEIVKNHTCVLDAGQHLLLLGPSGCGKTTLLHVMAGLLKPTSGDVVFEEINYRDLADHALSDLRAAHFGFVFQKIHLVGHLTVLQNIELIQQHENKDQILTMLEEVGLKDQANQLARDLSQGEAQRVAIIRALINQPKILFADEPTSALDDQNAERMMALITKLAEENGTTIIASTHDARIKKYFTNLKEISK